MSSAAAAGPPPDRSNITLGGGLGGGYDGANGIRLHGKEGIKANRRVIPHINDLLTVTPDVDRHAPMRRLLLEAENYAKNADTHLDFRRPDVALEEYLKAFIIAVEIIPRHKDYPELKRSDYQQLWTKLQKRIKTQGPKFEQVKLEIKKDNAETGIQPRLSANDGLTFKVQHSDSAHEELERKAPEGVSNGHTFAEQDRAAHAEEAQVAVASSPRKMPPRVQPKPNNLHGNTIKQVPTPPDQLKSLGAADIASRFARLRTSDSPVPVQDPRIRTRPIIPPSTNGNPGGIKPTVAPNVPSERPLGPRDMPRVPQGLPARPQKLPLDVNVPSMPRAPDAIYSPSRGPGDVPGVGGMPRSSPRTSYNAPPRTNSMASLNGGLRTSTTIEDRSDYFSQSASKSMTTSGPILPESTVVTAEDLMKYLKRGSQQLRVLLVDLRDREQFDDGHIMASSIICIEPIVLRKGISGDDLAQSMVLSPENERSLFDKRNDFDLVVFYDQASKSEMQKANSSIDGGASLGDFSRAVFDYSYDEKRLKRMPMLLVGGIDAWVDLMGPQSLATSETANAGPRSTKQTKPSRNGAVGLTRSRAATRRKTYESRPLTKEEESQWDETLKDEQVPSPSVLKNAVGENWSYAKTTEDFFRRFPEVAAQESMTVPRKVDPRPPQKPLSTTPAPIDASHHEELNTLMPRPPTRPSPAVPRPSYSGISDRDGHSSATTLSSREAHSNQIGPPPVQTLGDEVSVKGRTGLANFTNTCYMNSVLQSLSATPFLSWFLMTGDFEKSENKPQRRAGETTDPPQLMARNLANLLRHLWSGQFTYVTPKTFRVC